MEHKSAGSLSGGDPRDHRAPVTASRIIACCEHDSDGCLAAPTESNSAEIAGRSGSERGKQVTIEKRQQRLGLRISEAAVVLEHTGPLRRQHQPGEECPDERMAPCRELGQHRAAGEIDEFLDLVRSETGHRSERSHPAGIRATVTIFGALEVLRDRERKGRDAVAEREHRDLGAFQQLLDHERVRKPVELGEPRGHLVLGRAHDDALAGSQPIGLEDTGCDRLGERRRCRHTGDRHDGLGKRLRSFDRRGSTRRAEHRDADRAQQVGEAGHERHLGPDDDEVDLKRPGKIEHGLEIVSPDRMALPESRNAGITGSRVELRQKRRLDEFPGQGVLTATGSDEEDAHHASLLP